MSSPLRLVLAGCLAAGVVHAEGQAPHPPPGSALPARAEARPPLSDEDRKVVQELALLEKLELVRNLELFDPREPRDDDRPQPPPKPQ